MKLSDLAGPDAAGWSDVAVFVRADGSESDPFVVTADRNSGYVGIEYPDSRSAKGGGCPVRRLGRGRLVPARIEMEGEQVAGPRKPQCDCYARSRSECSCGCDSWPENEAVRLREQVRLLREALVKAAVPLEGLNASVQWELAPAIKRLIRETCEEIRAALAATAPTPTEDAK